MKSTGRRSGLLLLASVVVLASSCGKPIPKLVPVSGVVVNGDKPVSLVNVAFAADISKGGPTLDAYASTDAQGRFSLRTTLHGKGVPAGHYKVVISTDGPSGRLIPASITSLTTTKLEVDVPENGTEDMKIDLSKYN
jgi:hypothetical protein